MPDTWCTTNYANQFKVHPNGFLPSKAHQIVAPTKRESNLSAIREEPASWTRRLIIFQPKLKSHDNDGCFARFQFNLPYARHCASHALSQKSRVKMSESRLVGLEGSERVASPRCLANRLRFSQESDCSSYRAAAGDLLQKALSLSLLANMQKYCRKLQLITGTTAAQDPPASCTCSSI